MSKNKFNFKNICKEMITIIYLFISSKSFHGRRAHPLQLWQKVHVFKFLFEHEIRGGVVLETKQKQSCRITSSTNIR